MADLTDAELTELRRLLEAATAGPWRAEYDDESNIRGISMVVVGENDLVADLCRYADAALIAALVNAAPRLIEMAERAVRDPSAGHPATCRCTACFPG